jgi:tetratricopeptide (TPR) repeat protein
MTKGNRTTLAVCALLVIITFAVFGKTLGHGFVYYDDDKYVCDNVHVNQGFTPHGIAWAFTTSYQAYWHPLTWFSHMLDCQLWGLRASGHHLTNVLLHAANAVLLFLVLRRMTGANPGNSSKGEEIMWCSAFVATVFVVHPLDVESVAWVASRKNLLSTFFWLLTMWAYVRYVQRKWNVEGRESMAQSISTLGSRLWTFDYCLVLLFFVCGLMSKPMLVTLPFVLLLLDYWPLRRLALEDWRLTIKPLVFEKIPLLLLAIASSVLTILGQKSVGAITTLGKSPMSVRLGKVPVNYATYLRNIFWPENLAVAYPYPSTFSIVAVVLSVLLLAIVTLLVFKKVRTMPFLAVGWLWFVGTLVPVIGLIQVGNTQFADRFTYVPQIGLYFGLTWAVVELCNSSRLRRMALNGLFVLILVILSNGSWRQASFWKDGQSLWTHTLAVTTNNSVAYCNLGTVFLRKGEVDEALGYLDKALKIEPDDSEIQANIGLAHMQKGELDAAINWFQKSLEIKPNHPNEFISAEVNNVLGVALFQSGRVDEAITHYQKSLEIEPDNADTRNNLACALSLSGRVDEAIPQFQRSLELKPDNARAHNNLGRALLKKGQAAEAISHYQKAVEIEPENIETQNNLGNALLKEGRVKEAIVHFEACLKFRPDDADEENNLGSALLQNGQGDAAIAHFEKALKIKPEHVDAHFNLGNAFSQVGSVSNALFHFEKVLELQSDHVPAQNNLAFILAASSQPSMRNGGKAVKLAERANHLTGGEDPIILHTLAAGYAEAGRFNDALTSARKAVELARASGQQSLVDQLNIELKLYEAGHPFHEGNDQTGN